MNKAINVETIEKAKALFGRFESESPLETYWEEESSSFIFPMEQAVRDWYIASKNTVPLKLRVAVIAVTAAAGYPDGVFNGQLPSTEAVLDILPDVVRCLKKKLPIWMEHEVYAQGGMYDHSYWLRIF